MDESNPSVGEKVDQVAGKVDLTHKDNREIIALLTRMLDSAATRETELKTAFAEVTKSLREMTAAFRKQSEDVAKVLNLRQRVRELEDDLEKARTESAEAAEKLAEALAAAERQNQLARAKLEWVIKGLLYIVGPSVAGLVGIAVLAIFGSGG